MNISIIGIGFVGEAVYHAFCSHYDIKIYDKFKKGFNKFEETVNHADIIFVAVPTPMTNDGSQDMTIVENIISDINKHQTENKTVIIKSTVLPGTIRKLANKFKTTNLIFNPEFLTERTSLFDFLNQTRIILGGNNLEKAKQIYQTRFPQTPIFECSYEEAELVKYVENCFFALKISYMNEIYEICNKLEISYENVKKMFAADQRIANSHLEVPFQGNFGFGGNCFPKDSNGLIKFCQSIGLPLNTIQAALEVNDRVRTKL